MNCNTTHYRANSSSVPGDPTYSPAWFLNREVIVALAAGIVGSTPVVPRLSEWLARTNQDGERRLPLVPSIAGTVALLLLLAASLTLTAAQTYNPFIYFRF